MHLRLKPFAFAVTTLLAAFTVATPAHADPGTVDSVSVGKNAHFVQTSATTVIVDPAPQTADYGGPYSFQADIEGANVGNITTPTITLPAGSTFSGTYGAYGLYFNNDDQRWEFGIISSPNDWGTATKTELDSLFPSGTYTITVNGVELSFDLSGEVYPPTPLVTLSGGTWSGGKYLLPVNKALTITTSSFTTYGTHAEDIIYIETFDSLGNDVFEPPHFFASTSPSTKTGTYTVPANTFESGKEYQGDVGFEVWVSKPTGLSGSLNYAYYNKETAFTIQAIPGVYAPVITTQPVSQGFNNGANVSLSVTATGGSTYQWYKNGIAIKGATGATYTFKATAGSYTVVVTNSNGNSTSSAAVLTANVAPKITVSPVAKTVTVGASATFSVTATGTPAPTYQWYKNGSLIGGATASTYTIATTTGLSAGAYTVTATNAAGSVSSKSAALVVNIPPAITTQPVGSTVTAGASTSFSVTATGSPAPTYQWYKNGVAIGGATKALYTIAKTTAANAGSYTVTAKNSAGSAPSSPVTLTVNPAPVKPAITTQPLANTVVAGTSASFSVSVTGYPAPTYQWYKNGSPIGGATASTYTIATTTTADSGSYTVTATNPGGSITSKAALLTVNLPPSLFAAGTILSYNGTVTDSIDGVYADSDTTTITSPTTFPGGTFSYTRTSTTTGVLKYTYKETGYTETGTITYTFTSTTAGTFRTTGSYNDSGAKGTFTTIGTFTYSSP